MTAESDDAPVRYRKKPVEVEAIQWLGRENCDAVHDFVGLPRCGDDEVVDHSEFHIPTLEGTMTAIPGDWIIRGVQGEFYPCKPEIFEATYDRVIPPDGTDPDNPIIHRPGCSWETTPYCDCGADPERTEDQ